MYGSVCSLQLIHPRAALIYLVSCHLDLPLNIDKQGLPWWLSGRNLPANAGDLGLIPSLGRSHMLGTTMLLDHNYWTLVLEPRNCNYWAMCHSYWSLRPWSLDSTIREAHTLQLKSNPCLPQLEKNPCNNEEPAEPKVNKFFFLTK